MLYELLRSRFPWPMIGWLAVSVELLLIASVLKLLVR